MADPGPSRTGRTKFRDMGRNGPNQPTYEIFIGFLTILSLIVVALHYLVDTPEVDEILTGTDQLLCLIFFGDTARSWWNAPDRRAYVFGPAPGRSIPTGVVDLSGSIPTFPILRVLRIFRLDRVRRELRGRDPGDLVDDLVEHRAQVAGYLVATAAILVILIGSSVMAYVEPPAPGSNIKTGGDAFWWAFVTITTVGYGDRYPVTPEGRFIGVLTMAVGIGIFGVLTSFLAQWFLRRPHHRLGIAGAGLDRDSIDEAFGGIHNIPIPDGAPPRGPAAGSVAAASDSETAAELRALRDEVAELRRLIESLEVEDVEEREESS
ncbi:MAG TPA: potassium channel family protein [Candidatus Limnocylindrales bacterium]